MNFLFFSGLNKCEKKSNISLSKLQSPVTTQWLHDNYQMEDGVSLPRSSLYTHYLDFCMKNEICPVNAASFGKIIRNTFPDLKTRRLGTRGQSKYHYYGISVRPTSAYYEVVSNAARQSLSGFSQTYSKTDAEEKKVGTPKQQLHVPPANSPTPSNVPVSNQGTLLPEFPSVESISLDDPVLKDKVKTFLIMYRAHCQRILDTILRANFGEVQNFLIHFWQGIPAHITVILSHQPIIDLIGSCDHILYKAVGGVLVPGTLQPLPASLTQAIQHFAKQLLQWLGVALYHLPKDLQKKKLAVAKCFSQLLWRLTSLSHLAQAARTVLHNAEPSSQMLDDLQEIQFDIILKQALWISPKNAKRDQTFAQKFFDEFFDLLEQQATIEEYTEWISSLIFTCIILPSEKTDASFQTLAQEFLLKWSFITSKLIQELTLKSAKSFGSFHLLQMLFDDYIFYLIETHADLLEEVEDTILEKKLTIGFTAAPQPALNRMPAFHTNYFSSILPSPIHGRIPPTNHLSPQLENGQYYADSAVYHDVATINPAPNQLESRHHLSRHLSMFPEDDFHRYAAAAAAAQQQHQQQHQHDSSHAHAQMQSMTLPSPYKESIQTNSAMNSDFYYADDLEIVKQLQERTKTLMEASRFDTTAAAATGNAQRYDSYAQIPDYNTTHRAVYNMPTPSMIQQQQDNDESFVSMYGIPTHCSKEIIEV